MLGACLFWKIADQFLFKNIVGQRTIGLVGHDASG